VDREVAAPGVESARDPRSASRLPAGIAHAAAGTALAAMVWLAAQPVMTDDVWWHLAMGEIYAHAGPWLDEDPLLHTATKAPAPAAWLADIGLHAASKVAGIQGLRCLHALLVIAILVSAWSLLRRTSRSALFASLGSVLFVDLAAYRLVQLRPHLLTMLATLVLVHLLITPGDDRAEPGSPRRHPLQSWPLALLLVVLFGVWANSHAAFMLGPILFGAALAGLVGTDLLAARGRLRFERRTVWLAALWALATAATLLNPDGPDQLLHYFVAGESSPELGVVLDEWTPLDPLALPPPNLPPSTLAWAIACGLLVTTPLVVADAVRHRLRAPDASGMSSSGASLDPMLAAMALASLVALCAAVRFLWLGVIPIALVGEALAVRSIAVTRRSRTRWAAAAAVVLLLPASVRFGDWPMISQGARPSLYARPFAAMKYHAHAVWLLADMGVEGRLFNSYFMGNFLGYWLAPRLKAFTNGSLNLPPETMRDGRALMARTGGQSGLGFAELLDRHEVDVFFGEGMPVVSRRNRPADTTVAHLDGTPGWIPIFRNVDSSLYVRDVPRNRDDLDRVAAYYEREGVPFDDRRGFVVADVVQRAPEWAHAHAVVPARFEARQRQANSGDPFRRRAARDDLAALYLLVGEYERAVSLLRMLVRNDPTDERAGRRLVWARLRAGRFEAARDQAQKLLSEDAALEPLTRHIARKAEELASMSGEEARARVATLPVFMRVELAAVFHGFVEPEARPLRTDRLRSRRDAQPAGASPAEGASRDVSVESTEPASSSVASDRGGSFSK